MKYLLDILSASLDHPTVPLRAFNRFYHNRLRGEPFLGESYNPNGTDIFQHDWDNLIILDGCRYDTFAEEATIDEEVSFRWSKAAYTGNFVRANFKDRDLQDVVYATAQFMIRKVANEGPSFNFHRIIELPPKDENNPYRPIEKVATDAREIASEFPRKRLIVHVVEPHLPFFDTLSDEEWPDSEPPREALRTQEDIYDYLRFESTLPPELVREAYRRKLKSALPTAIKLARDLPGRTILTSDHGNMWGERALPFPVKEWGHPPNLYVDSLAKVPLVVFEADERKNIESEPAEDCMWVSESGIESDVEERLDALGYR